MYPNYNDSVYDLYETTTNSISFGGGFWAFLAGVWFFILLFAVFAIICQWRIFKKAGKEGWEAIIPIYNTWILFEIVGLKGWYVLLNLIPVIGNIIFLIFSIISMIKLAKCFGKSEAFAVGLIFLPIIFFPMLAFGNTAYTKPATVAGI